MKPVFIDFHIHTSENPAELNEAYDLDILKSKIEEVADGSQYMISLTDHNTINKTVYLNALVKFENLLLGVELHIRNYDQATPYHAHLLLNLKEITGEIIDDINEILDDLYPRKEVSRNDTSIPKLDQIMNKFDEYDFLLLPHGGQNHSTFNKSIPPGVQFDRTLERNIYYNHFDGFTARSNKGLGNTHDYFQKLGIIDFVNLVTATDNYSPTTYPSCKAGSDAAEFIPTWMLATPTFNGVRMSLSESSRLFYGDKPDSWAECIQSVYLKNDSIDIDATLTPGLNVVIGGSSSGKSLLVDSIYRKIIGDFDGSMYRDTIYQVDDIHVDNPAGQYPHYLDQNYISKICDPKNQEYTIDDITILKNVFPSDNEERESISNGLSELSTEMTKLVYSVKEIEKLHEILKRIPKLSHLIVTDTIHANPLRPLLPDDSLLRKVEYGQARYERDRDYLERLEDYLSNNPLIDHDQTLTAKLNNEIRMAFEASTFETQINTAIQRFKNEIDSEQEEENRETTVKRTQFEDLLESIKKYFQLSKVFNDSVQAISKFKIRISTKEIESMGHKLFIENEFELTKEKFLEVVNGMLKREFKIDSFSDLSPEKLFEGRFSQRAPKVADYDEFERKLNSKFQGMNQKKYRIITVEGHDFDNLSAGWKTSVILDLILGWGSDNAPLIIDQPEDNLATGYINDGLLTAIKKCKTKKQIILVSHNATIPMLGDAQNIVLCINKNNHITIRSDYLEGQIGDVGVVELIAKITDGGKASVKKRVKKYNLKSFRGSHEATV